eukprot:CAMPEP_0170167678 /NCGR_PEP_ID=MMETSP0040_2-20121228/1017_1 /TAXON_ID=641309 /ORGANISM="Lotharella oceanica, Strain CCMP622" /LENGTH=126 /DNA_ID=CAMNT_0010405777 /DNA_START=160 /DNA_END=540 /DNA_ORIENTATION=+
MDRARIMRWHVGQGERIEMTQLLAELEVEGLLADPEEKGRKVSMEIESHEEGYVARVFLQEGETAPPGVPIALMCEREEDIPEFASVDVPQDVSDSMFVWQAYVAEEKDSQEHGRIPEHNRNKSGD